EQFREQQEGARERTHQQRSHVAHLAVVHHGERGLHAVEQLDHHHQAGGYVFLVQDVDFVGRNDRDPEHLPESGGEDEQPYQRPHQRRDEALALVQKAQRLAPSDPLEADRIGGQRSGSCRCSRQRRHAASLGPSALVSAPNAPRMSAAAVCARMLATGPCASTFPRCSTMTPSLSATSSTRCVAHSTQTPSRATRSCTWRKISARALMSSPTVGSSSTRSCGRCSSARAISTRRICPPDSARTLSPARSDRLTRASTVCARCRASRVPMPCSAA